MKLPIKVQPANPAHRDINSHSVDVILNSAEGLGPVELRNFARDVVREVAAGCEMSGALDVSHVKAFIEYSSGFLHASAVSGNEEIRVAGRDGRTASRFHLVLNAVIFGLPQDMIRTAADCAFEMVQVQYGLTPERPAHCDENRGKATGADENR